MIDNNPTPTTEKAWPKTNGMTVPEGYFEAFADRMMARLPEEPAQPRVAHGWWQKVKPYTYMAAMFAGAWLLLNIFAIGHSVKAGVEVPAAGSTDLIAQMVNTNTKSYVDDYISVSDYELYDELYESGFEIPEQI